MPGRIEGFPYSNAGVLIMKNLFYVLLISVVSGLFIYTLVHKLTNGVEQESRASMPQTNQLLCGCKVCVATYVWKDEEIIQSWYDHPDSTASISLHKKQADSLYAHINKF